MNTLPKVIEEIILDYKYQLDFNDILELIKKNKTKATLMNHIKNEIYYFYENEYYSSITIHTYNIIIFSPMLFVKKYVKYYKVKNKFIHFRSKCHDIIIKKYRKN